VLSPADVTAVLVTRGDVDLGVIFDTLIFPEVVVWDNTKANDLKAFGRYAAMQFQVTTPYVYTQDDDCIVSPEAQAQLLGAASPDAIVCNMPSDHGLGHPRLKLLGWGSIFETRLPFVAFQRWLEAGHEVTSDDFLVVGADIIFPCLTFGVRYDLGHEERPFSHESNRTHNQHGYAETKQRFYEACGELLAGAGE
jgi:hypothetical protein